MHETKHSDSTVFDRRSESGQVNYVRNTTVHSEVKPLQNIPPIQAAVKQHIRLGLV